MQSILQILVAGSISLAALWSPASSLAALRNCHARGLGGVYASWSKSAAASGAGSFVVASPNVARLPSFTWQVTGSPLSVQVQSGEPFHGGNSMKGIYGLAGQLARYARTAKLNAIKACKLVEDPNRQDNRPIIADYLRFLVREISKLPLSVRRCE
jgi:hypothetical protein